MEPDPVAMTSRELVEILGFVFVISSMLTVGLEVTREELLMVFKNRQLAARILLANFIIVPLLGLLLVALFGIRSDFAIGFLLMASAPGGFHSLQFSGKVKSHLALAASSLFLLSSIALVLTPMIALLLLKVNHIVTWKYFELIMFLALGQLLPLLSGFSLKRRAPSIADRLRTPMAYLSNLSFLIYVIAMGTMNKVAFRAIDGGELAAVIILILASLLAGWWAGGSELGSRVVTGASTSMRNGAICLTIAVASMPETDVQVSIIVYMALMVPVNTIFLIYGKVRARRRGNARGT